MFDLHQAKKDVKLVCLDMDGTLLAKNREIPHLHRQLPAFLKQHGVRFTLITGRPPYMCVKEISEMQLTEPFVCANGALLCAPTGGWLREGLLIDYSRAHQFIMFLQAAKINFYLYTPERIYTCPDDFTHARIWRARLQNEILPAHRWEVLTLKQFDAKKEAVLKFLVCTNNPERVEAYIQDHPEIGLNFARTTPESLDVCDQRADKGAGLTALLDELHFQPHQVMVFGDGGNDIPMFKVAKYAVAMANAPAFVKAAASAVTTQPNDHGGAYSFLQTVFA